MWALIGANSTPGGMSVYPNRRWTYSNAADAYCLIAHLPEDSGMEYLSEWRLRMAPMLGTLAGLRTEGTWGIWLSGVIGVVGVVGVWGRFGGDTDGRFFDMVMLDTRFNWWGGKEMGDDERERERMRAFQFWRTQTNKSRFRCTAVFTLISCRENSQSPLITGWNAIIRILIRACC